MQIISRAQASLPAVPSSIGWRSLSSWTGIRVHHTGGAFSSWKAVHDWQTTGRPADGSQGQRLAYIGYSFGIAGGRITELLGWDRHPAHDHENSRLGVVFGGKYDTTLPPAADLDALVWLIQEARRRTGKSSLSVSTHREAWPAGDWRSTTCPGARLHAWCRNTLPTRLTNEEDDMPTAKEIAAELAKNSTYLDAVSRATWARVQPSESKAATKAAGKNATVTYADVIRGHSARWNALRASVAAILSAVSGRDDTLRAELEDLAAAERDERAAELAPLAEALERAEAEREALAELIRQNQSGQLAADEVVRQMGERLRIPPSAVA